MKNLKVYERLTRFKNKSLYEKKRFRMKLVALFTIPVLMTGCYKTLIQKDNNDYNVNVSDIVSSDIISEDKNEVIEFTDIEKSYLKKNIKIEDSDYNKLSQYISEVDSNYIYEDIYDVSTAYDKYKSIYKYNGDISENIISNMKIDNNSLYNLVLNNNEAYFSGEHNPIHYKLDNKIVKNICDVIADTINKEFSERNFDTNIDDISYNLSNLKIVDGATFSAAYVTDDDVLAISMPQIENMGLLVGVSDSFEKTIAHETEHILQKLSNETITHENVERGHGFCLEFNDINVNSLYYMWLIEGSAENLAVRFYDGKPSTYFNKIGYINSLSLTQILDNSFEVYDVEKLTQQSKLEEVFKLFKTDTIEEKKELLNMLYTIEVIQEAPDDFITSYEQVELNGNTISEEQLDNLRYSLKGSVCTTLTKYFYLNLTEKIKNEEMTTEDVLNLISLFEEDIQKHILYDNESMKEYNREFIIKYLDIQKQFFELISKKIDIDVEQIDYMYKVYDSNINYTFDNKFEKITEPINIENISSQKNNFLSKIRNNYIESKTITINEAYKKIYNSEYIK